MNDAQVWSIVAVMAAGLATMISLTFRYVGARFDAFDAKWTGRFEVIDERFARMDDRFQRMDERFDHLDRDMQRVIERIFPVN